MKKNLLLAILFLLAVPLVFVPAESKAADIQVNTYTTGGQYNPSVAMNSNGNFVITWDSAWQDGDWNGIYAQMYDSSGNPVGSEFQVNTYTTYIQSFPSVAMDSNGNFVIAWSSGRQDGDWGGIYAQMYDSSGNPVGSEFRVNTYTTGNQVRPSVAMNSNGNFVIAWQDDTQDGSGAGVYAQMYDSSGNTVGSEFQVNTYTSNHQSVPSVAMDSNGNFVIAWSSLYQDGSDRGVYAQRYDSSGNPVGSEFQVNTYTTGDQDYHSVAMDSNGNFVIAWSSLYQDGSANGIYAQRYDSLGNPVGSEFQVNTYTTDDQSSPSVAMDSNGNFVIPWGDCRWLDEFTQDCNIYAQRYDSSGNPVGSEFQVNDTPGDQRYPSVAMGSYGNFVIIWNEISGQDGDASGVFMRPYIDTTQPVFGGIDWCDNMGDWYGNSDWGGYIWVQWDWATDDSGELPDYNIYWSHVSGGQDFNNPNYFTWENYFAFTDYEGITLDVPYYFVVRAIDGSGNEETNTVECSATARSDFDYDGYSFIGSGTGSQDDCDDGNPLINPAAVEDCTDLIDNDCDNLIDAQDPDAVGCPIPICGNGTIETGEACDDGAAANGTTTCGCQSDCTYAPAATSCADGLYCNGDETCDGTGTCQAGTVVPVDDGVTCTIDSCDEVNDVVVNTPDDSACDNGEFCDGSETCDAFGGCQAGSDPCSVGDICNETTDTCDLSCAYTYTDKTSCNADSACSWNNGAKICEDVAVCVPDQTPEATCTDGVDNDCDGLTDCADTADCGADPACQGGSCDTITDKGTCNGDPNCEWSGSPKNGTCQDAVSCVPDETPEATCYDGIDNDCDGLIDCYDHDDCTGALGCVAGSCANNHLWNKQSCEADPDCEWNNTDGYCQECVGGCCYPDKINCEYYGCTWNDTDSVCM